MTPLASALRWMTSYVPAMPAAPPALEWRRAASLHAERSRSVARELALAQAPCVCRALGHTPRRLQMRARAATMTSDWNAVGSAGGEFVAAVLRRARTRTAVPTAPALHRSGSARPRPLRAMRGGVCAAPSARLWPGFRIATRRVPPRPWVRRYAACLRRRAEGPLYGVSRQPTPRPWLAGGCRGGADCWEAAEGAPDALISWARALDAAWPLAIGSCGGGRSRARHWRRQRCSPCSARSVCARRSKPARSLLLCEYPIGTARYWSPTRLKGALRASVGLMTVPPSVTRMHERTAARGTHSCATVVLQELF